ncbi:hypothetical protein ABTK86_19460, partial [Acinetobacter baumannii]
RPDPARAVRCAGLPFQGPHQATAQPGAVRPQAATHLGSSPRWRRPLAVRPLASWIGGTPPHLPG